MRRALVQRQDRILELEGRCRIERMKKHAPLSPVTVGRLDWAGQHIELGWAMLRLNGFSLTDYLFDVLGSLRVSTSGLKCPKFFYQESLREQLSCEFCAWTLLHRQQFAGKYRSSYLDWIEERHSSGEWPQIAAFGGKATRKQDPAVAHFTRLKYGAATDAQTRSTWEHILEGIVATKDKEAKALLERTNLTHVRAPLMFSDVRQLLDPLFQQWGFTYDNTRSTSAAVTYACAIAGTTDSVVCSLGEFDKSMSVASWPATLGVVGADVRRPILGHDPRMPMVIDFEQAYPGTQWYLTHENTDGGIKLGAAFLGTASGIFADLINRAHM
jgi:hypothetical protein